MSPQLMHLSPKIFGALHREQNPLSLCPIRHHNVIEITKTIIGVPTPQLITKPMSINQKIQFIDK